MVVFIFLYIQRTEIKIERQKAQKLQSDRRAMIVGDIKNERNNNDLRICHQAIQ